MIMEEDTLVQVLTNYLDGNLSEDEILVVEKELANNPTARKILEQLKEMLGVINTSEELSPSPSLQQNFSALLKAEIDKKEDRKVLFFNSVYFKVAAAVLLLIVAGSVGFFIGEQRNATDVVEKNEVSQTVLLAKLDNQYSVSQRLIAINEVYEASPDDELVKALIKLMNEDTNTNVRLAAVSALVRFYNEPFVRQSLIDALSTQTDPLVQIELIQILVYKKEQEAVKPLENIINNDQTLQVVKDEAHAGLFSLS